MAVRERIVETLWPATRPRWLKICTVLDGARDPRIFPAIERCGLDKCCLYAGDLPLSIQRVAPYLVLLDPGDRFTRLLLEEGWGNNWGIFLRSEDNLLALRRHLRTLLRVKDQSGRILIFRWYDPRVLRLYLPTCTPAELRTFFGPVDRFYAEGKDPAELLEYAFGGKELRTDARPAGVPLPAAPVVSG